MPVPDAGGMGRRARMAPLSSSVAQANAASHQLEMGSVRCVLAMYPTAASWSSPEESGLAWPSWAASMRYFLSEVTVRYF
jgi:hypothetical protein